LQASQTKARARIRWLVTHHTPNGEASHPQKNYRQVTIIITMIGTDGTAGATVAAAAATAAITTTTTTTTTTYYYYYYHHHHQYF